MQGKTFRIINQFHAYYGHSGVILSVHSDSDGVCVFGKLKNNKEVFLDETDIEVSRKSK